MGTTEEENYGDFTSDTLAAVIEEYNSLLPDMELPSKGILDTVLLFLRTLFYLLPEEHEFRWEGNPDAIESHEDQATTGITITRQWPIDPEVLEIRPAIVVELGDRGFSGMHLDQQKFLDFKHGSETKHDLIRGALQTHIVSRHGYLCTRLADWVGLNYRLLNKNLTFGNRFHTILPDLQWSQVGSAGKLVRAADHEYLKATVSFNYTWSWTGRTELRNPTTFSGFQMDLISYGRRLDVTSGESGIVDTIDPVTHIIEVDD